MKARGIDVTAKDLLATDNSLRQKTENLQQQQKQRNDLARAVAESKKNGENVTDLLTQAEKIKNSIADIEKIKKQLEESLYKQLSELPNLPEEKVPFGEDENSNVEIKKYGEPRKFDFTPKQHFEIGENLGQLDFKIAAQMSGSRFYISTEKIAKLSRAVANFCLDLHTKKHGYTEVLPPLLVRDHAMFNAGQLPKFAADSFVVNDNEYRLIPTAEVSLVNLAADTIFAEEQLPLRLVAHTPSFRSEAGSAGKDTRGMIRIHHFYKVELVHILKPEQAEQEFQHMLSSAEEVLKQLKIPYRVLLLCSQDMGFAAQKTYDLEAWMPGQNKYREISSCSQCGNFQAVRMKARFKKKETGQNVFVYTTNGSALAIERTIVAILENYQNEDGTVDIPEALVPYMGGLKKIEYSSFPNVLKRY